MPQPNRVIISHDKAKEERHFFIQLSEQGYIETVHLIIQKEPAPEHPPYSFIQPLTEIIDDVLQLKLREDMYFNPSKRDPKAKAILTRTKFSSINF
jgi:hypothetical protein